MGIVPPVVLTGGTTFVGNRPKRVGKDCLFCKYRNQVDFDNNVVECNYVRHAKDKV